MKLKQIVSTALPHGRSSLAVTLVGLTSVSIAFAAGPGKPERFPINIAELENKAEARFAAIDSNESGTIELEEFLQAEGPRHHARHPGQRRGQHQQHDGRMAKHARHKRSTALGDPEQSSEVREEIRAAINDISFRLLDTNGDGNVSEEEFDVADHRAIRKEARRTAMFSHLDEDNSGSLDATEMPSRLERLRSMDADGDGQVTRQEFRAARRDTKA